MLPPAWRAPGAASMGIGHQFTDNELASSWPSAPLKKLSQSRCKENEMNGSRYYRVRVAGAKYGVGFGSALAITISYSANHSILWAIIHGILSWLYGALPLMLATKGEAARTLICDG